MNGISHQKVHRTPFAHTHYEEGAVRKVRKLFTSSSAKTPFDGTQLFSGMNSNPTKEARDLWARVVVGKDGDKENYLWTVEHIFPQTEKFSSKWVDMVGGVDEARLIHDNDLHTLGNLTLSAYNSALGTKSFQEKRDRLDDDGEPIGYKNGLKINLELADHNTWNRSIIESRTIELARNALALFPL